MFELVNTMNSTRRFALTFEAPTELAADINSSQAAPAMGLPNLSEVLAEISPLPRQALFLGIAGDGLPVLLNLWDPVAGPILITGDTDSGKTRLLQTIARGVDQVHPSKNVKYVVLAGNRDNWNPIDRFTNCDGILPSGSAETANYLRDLAEWAHESRDEKQTVLLLIDDLKALVSSGESHQYLRWLLFQGPGRRIWPIATLNTDQANRIGSWLEAFRTRLHGRMEMINDVGWLDAKSNYFFKDLIPGSQFAMREGNSWLPFWLPRID
jgi:hypothetical protein